MIGVGWRLVPEHRVGKSAGLATSISRSVLGLAAQPGATPGLHADPELGLVEAADIRDPLADLDGIVGAA